MIQETHAACLLYTKDVDVPRGGVPCRNVTSARRRTGSQRVEPTCPAQRACGSTRQCAAVCGASVAR
eukprot:3666813-Prymnesium_polylepis.1